MNLPVIELIPIEAFAQSKAEHCKTTGLPLVIIVGLTGSGKSTFLEELGRRREFALLPNRRWLADEVIIPAALAALGEANAKVRDRLERFRLTAHYRKSHPGGSAEALATLAIHTERAHKLLLFDGLRGVDEVRWASENFPKARFVVLEASDDVRVERLLGRGDEFDAAAAKIDGDLLESVTAINGVFDVYSPADIERLCRIAASASMTPDTALSKISILVAERRNYNPTTTRDYLLACLSSSRFLLLNSGERTPPELVADFNQWLRNENTQVH